MKIGVVSDTHSIEVPKKVLKALEETDLIIHAGDFCSLDDYKMFKSLNKLRAVYGNMDEPEVRKKLGMHELFEFDQFRIGITHGHGAERDTLGFVQEEFKKEKPDVVVFGHTHKPFNEKIGKTLYFNPGSPNDTIYAPFCSYGILEVKNGELAGKIIKV